MGNVDNAIMITRSGKFEEMADGKRHEIRQWTVAKQKDEADGLTRSFYLKQIVLDVDPDGDEVSSCIVEPIGDVGSALIAPGQRKAAPQGYYELFKANEDLFRSLARALKKKGRSAPAGVEAPAGAMVVTIGEWQDEVLELSVGHEEVTNTLKQRIKKRIQRACAQWDGEPGHPNLLGKSKEFIWRTTRKVWPIDPGPPEPRPNPTPIMAPGETQGDINDVIGDY